MLIYVMDWRNLFATFVILFLADPFSTKSYYKNSYIHFIRETKVKNLMYHSSQSCELWKFWEPSSLVTWYISASMSSLHFWKRDCDIHFLLLSQLNDYSNNKKSSKKKLLWSDTTIVLEKVRKVVVRCWAFKKEMIRFFSSYLHVRSDNKEEGYAPQ